MNIKSLILSLTMMLCFCSCINGSEKNTKMNTIAQEDAFVTLKTSLGDITLRLYGDTPKHKENFLKLVREGFYDGVLFHRVINEFMFQGGSTNGDGTGGDAAVNGGSFGIETAQNARHYYGALCYANARGSNTTQFYIVNNKKAQDLGDFDYDRYNSIIAEGKDLIKQSIAGGQTMYEEYYRYQTQYYQNTVDWFSGATDAVKAKYKANGGTPSLDGNYTVFGQVYEGFDVIDKISAVSVKDNGSGEKSKPVEDVIIKSVKVTVYGDNSGESSALS